MPRFQLRMHVHLRQCTKCHSDQRIAQTCLAIHLQTAHEWSSVRRRLEVSEHGVVVLLVLSFLRVELCSHQKIVLRWLIHGLLLQGLQPQAQKNNQRVSLVFAACPSLRSTRCCCCCCSPVARMKGSAVRPKELDPAAVSCTLF